MMDPNIGWFQPEHKGPALDLYMKVWKKYNVNQCSHPNHDMSEYIHNRRHRSQSLSRPWNRSENMYSIYNFNDNYYLCRKYEGTPWRRLRDFYDTGLTALHQEIEDFYQYMKPIAEEEYMREKVFQKIKKIITNLWPEALVDCYGSFRTGTYLPTSDIDLVVMGEWDTSPLIQLQMKFLELRICEPTTIRVLDNASIPLIKLTDKRTGLRVNICFNLKNISRSVFLIKEYIEKFPNMVKLVYVIKQFVLQRNMNEVFTGGISSYAITLMVVNFFQMHPKLESNSPNANLGALLLEFFQLYGQQLNYEKVGLRIRDGGCYVKKEELLNNMDYCYRPSLLCIEDPFNPTNNVCKNSYAVDKVKNAFDYAYDVLYRAIGPLNTTVDQTQTLLGRIIRVTDYVIENRAKIKSWFRCDVEDFRIPSSYFNRNSGAGSSGANRGRKNQRAINFSREGSLDSNRSRSAQQLNNTFRELNLDSNQGRNSRQFNTTSREASMDSNRDRNNERTNNSSGELIFNSNRGRNYKRFDNFGGHYYHNRYQNNGFREYYNRQNSMAGNTSLNSNREFHNDRFQHFRRRNESHEDYAHYHNHSSYNHQNSGQYSGKSFGQQIRKQRSNTFE